MDPEIRKKQMEEEELNKPQVQGRAGINPLIVGGAVKAISSMMPEGEAPQAPKPDVNAYLMDKMAQRKQLQQNVNNAGSPWGAALAGFGAGLQGHSVSEGYDHAQKLGKAHATQALHDFDENKKLKAEEEKQVANKDVKGNRASIVHALILKAMPNFEKLTGRKVNSITPEEAKDYLSHFDTMSKNMQTQDHQNALLTEARLGRQERSQERDDARNAKVEEKIRSEQVKKDAALLAHKTKAEDAAKMIEERRTNIMDNIKSLEDMINENGTWEMFGSHNQDIQRKEDQVATDMAKLQDIQSVARPSEVEQVTKTLPKVGFSNSNSTAKDLLKNFKEEVHKRADNAYKIHGITLPVKQDAKPIKQASKQELDAMTPAQLEEYLKSLGE